MTISYHYGIPCSCWFNCAIDQWMHFVSLNLKQTNKQKFLNISV